MSEPQQTHAEPIAATAGEQNHVDPNEFRGEDANAPGDTGTPPQEH